jgi:hypothetical protein
MNSMSDHLEELKEIRSMMQKSTRFISLSGLSGIFAGVYALIGAFVAYRYLEFYGNIRQFFASVGLNTINHKFIFFLIIDAGTVLVLALGTSFFLTARNIKKNNESMFSPTAIRLVINMMIPLVVGGTFSLILLSYGYIGLVAPSMLIFYGLALMNASAYTIRDIRYLGYLEILIGFIALLDSGNGLFYWSLGFGLLHIVYGTYMYFKYEYKKDA